MSVPPARITRVDWLRVFPVLHVRDALRAAFTVQAVVPVLLAVLLAGFGQSGIDRVLSGTASDRVSTSTTSVNEDAAIRQSLAIGEVAEGLILDNVGEPIRNYWSWLVCSQPTSLHWLATMMWQMLVWSIPGLAVCRSTSEAACRDRRSGVLGSCLFACRQWKTLLGVLLIVSALLFASRVPFAVASWMCGYGDDQIWWLIPIRDVLLLLSIGSGFLMGTVFFLSIAAVGVDRCGAADAVSRCVSYVLSHKIRTLVYGIVLLGCVSLCHAFASTLLDVGVAGVRNLDARGAVAADVAMPRLSLIGMRSWVPAVVSVAAFWAGTSVMYRLLRHVEDSIRMDEMQEDLRRTERSKAGA